MSYQKDSEPAGEQMTLFSQAGSLNPASHTAQQESEKARKMIATSGLRCLEQFGKFPRATSWAKTFAGSLIGMEGWYSMRCRLTWKLKATKCSRFYCQLQVSTLPTEGIGSGLLPTAQTQGLKVCEEGKTRFVNLGLLPTPQVFDAEGTFIKGKHYNGKNKHAEKLGQAIVRMGLLPTPQAAEGYKLTGSENQDSLIKRIGKTSQLNPLFVQEMMGFPVDWLTGPFLQNQEPDYLKEIRHTEGGEKKA
jgi:hypothetical protein